jgi:hypothetical protein
MLQRENGTAIAGLGQMHNSVDLRFSFLYLQRLHGCYSRRRLREHKADGECSCIVTGKYIGSSLRSG